MVGRAGRLIVFRCFDTQKKCVQYLVVVSYTCSSINADFVGVAGGNYIGFGLKVDDAATAFPRRKGVTDQQVATSLVSV